MNLNLENELKEELNELKENNLIRTVDDLRFISSTKAIDKDNKEYLVFGIQSPMPLDRLLLGNRAQGHNIP